MAQNRVKSRPIAQRREGWWGILWGAKTSAQRNVTSTVDPAVQSACGRQSGADQAPMARTLPACTAEHVAQLERVSRDDLQRDGVTPRPPVQAARLGVAAEVPPRPIGPQADGRERAGRGRHRRKTGRQTLRLTASAAREIGPATLWRGKAAAVPALQAALVERESPLGWTRQSRQRRVIRLEGGAARRACALGA